MKSDKMEFPYVILNSDKEITDELGSTSDTSCCLYKDEDDALNDIRYIYKNNNEDPGPFYVGKVTLISKVYPPTDLKIEKL